jgi:formylglycine-generating enzyme required for sulfatase activity
MTTTTGKIFISYRQSDSIAETGRIYDRLVREFGPDNVFKDVNSIPLGVDFAQYIDQEVGRCQVLLVVMGKNWITPRLQNPDDFVRLEIESALKRDIPVVPVFLEGVIGPPPRDQLPESLHPLIRRNGTPVGHDPRFHADMDRLINALRKNNIQQPSVPVDPPVSISPPAQPPDSPKSEPTYPRFSFEVVTVNPQGQVVDSQQASAPYQTVDLGQGVTLDMVLIPEGSFLMGQTEAEKTELIRQVGEEEYKKYFAWELPRHSVTLAAFALGKYPITQGQWRAVMGNNPSHFKGDNRPVEQVNWHDAIEFCDRLSKKQGQPYTLPSEAQWEYACRAGTTTPFHFGETITTDLANYRGADREYEGKTYPGFYGQGPRGAYREQTTEVGSFPPNGFGLYDMHGNVWEWCLDHFHDSYNGAPADGSAWVTGGDSSRRMLRGGSWLSNPRGCRCACRFFNGFPVNRNNIDGFRVVSVPPRALG